MPGFLPGFFGNGERPTPRRCMDCGAPSPTVRCPACALRQAAKMDDLIHGQMGDSSLPTWLRPAAQPAKPTVEAASSPSFGDLLADEFAKTLQQVRQAPTTRPPTAYWTSACRWCAREMRERSDANETYQPQASRVETCPRHHRGLQRLMAWLRDLRWGGQGGQPGGAA